MDNPWAPPAARLAPPPRGVPLSLRAAMMTNGHVKYGTAMFVPAMIFFWWVAGGSLREIPFLFAGSMIRVDATVIASEQTHWGRGRGGLGGRSTPMYRSRYRFVDASGQRRHGVSYTPGDKVEGRSLVEIEYSPRWLSLNRIVGGGASPNGLPALTSIFFALLSLRALIPGVRRGRRAIQLLIDGDLATGRIVSSRVKADAPSKPGGRKPIEIECEVEFTTSLGQRVTARETRDDRLDEIRVGAEVPILYDRREPARGMMMTSLPASPTTDPSGHWHAVGARPIRLFTILALAHAAHVVFAIVVMSEP